MPKRTVYACFFFAELGVSDFDDDAEDNFFSNLKPIPGLRVTVQPLACFFFASASNLSDSPVVLSSLVNITNLISKLMSQKRL